MADHRPPSAATGAAASGGPQRHPGDRPWPSGDTVWLDDAEQRLWRAAVAAVPRVLDRLDAELQGRHGLSFGEYEVLVHLSEAPGGCLRMGSLAALVAMSPSGLTRRVRGLAARGLVARQPFPGDRRGAMAALTEEGAAVLAGAAPDHVAGVRRWVLAVLPAELRPPLTGALEEAARRLSPDQPR